MEPQESKTWSLTLKVKRPKLHLTISFLQVALHWIQNSSLVPNHRNCCVAEFLNTKQYFVGADGTGMTVRLFSWRRGQGDACWIFKTHQKHTAMRSLTFAFVGHSPSGSFLNCAIRFSFPISVPRLVMQSCVEALWKVHGCCLGGVLVSFQGSSNV